MYISEVSHPKVRGTLGSCVQLMVVTGILGAYVAGIWVRALGYKKELVHVMKELC